MKLSIVVPVHNEASTLARILEKLLELDFVSEVIVVDDGSSDGSRRLLEEIAQSDEHIRPFFHPHRQGKGAAVRTGLQHVSGDLMVVQDADLEYEPKELYELLRLCEERGAEVVYGSRFLGAHTGLYFWNAIGNKCIAFLASLLYNAWISDIETCYKMVRTDILRELDLQCNGFDWEAEVTAKLLKRGYRIFEVPISYFGRTYEEGKKIRWRDGFRAIWVLFRYRFTR